MPLAALFVQPDPEPPALQVTIFHLHGHRGAHARKGEHHEADEGVRLDAVEQGPGFVRVQYRRLALPLRMFRSAHILGRVLVIDLLWE
jgi:hypothetical protein